MEDKLRAFVAEAALRNSKLSKIRSRIMLRHGYDLSISVIKRLLTRQAFGARPLKFRISSGFNSMFPDRSVHVVELDLSELDIAEPAPAEGITITVGAKTIELPISANTAESMSALHAAGVGQ